MLSIVIPVFNERDSLEALHRELDEVAAAAGLRAGRRLRRRRLDRRLVGGDPPAGRRRSAGPRAFAFAATSARRRRCRPAFAQARGELVMTLDADLQDDPHEIPRFLAAMDERPGRGQRLEAGPPRSLAQGAALAGVQLAWSAG